MRSFRRNMKSLFLLLHFTGYVLCTFPLNSAKLNFSELSFYINDPDSYTVYLADRSRITPDRVPSSDVLTPRYTPYFRADLFEEGKATFSQTSPQSAKKWIRISESPDNSFLIARLMMPNSSSAEGFLERISTPLLAGGQNEQLPEEGQTPDLDDFSFSGGMIIFPQNERYATIFTLGSAWKTLLNPYVIVPRWGLRVVASEDFCNPRQIREIAASYFRNPIPSKRKERSAEVEDISRFGIEVASEGIESLRVRPASSYGMKRIVKGADYLNFCVVKRDKTNPDTTFASLRSVSTYLFNLSMESSFSIHKNLRCFVDGESQKEVVNALSEKLLRVIRSEEDGYNPKYALFLHDWIWGLFDTKVLRFGEGKTTQIHDHFSSVKTLQSPIKITTVKGNRSSYEPVGKLLYSLPIEHEGRFYRYDRGMWFDVDASRFEAIKKVMRSFKKSSQDLGLPEYCLDDLMGDRKDYPELRYNKRAVRHLNSLPNHQAYLIDRLNISLKKGGGHIFEFGDIFLIKNKQYYIIHVKRANADALSHHREQVERSADYLTTLDREANASFFLKASIEDLLREHKLKGSKKQEDLFQKNLKGRHATSRRLEVILETPEVEPVEESAKTLFTFKRLVLRILRETSSVDFFNQHVDAFCEALDVLFFCVQDGKIDLGKESSNTETQISSFIERARLAIEGGTALFSNGLLKKSNQKKVTFVLAVVDDRGVEQFVDTEIKKEDKKLERNQAKKIVLDRFRNEQSRFIELMKQDRINSLFNSQDLWGLDRTRMAVQNQGFPFLLVVTNEYKDETWDAFGPIGDSLEEAEEVKEEKEKVEPLEQSKEIPFPKGIQVKTKEACNKIVAHMRDNPSKKYTVNEIESIKILDIDNARTPLEKLFELKVLQKEKHSRSFRYFLNEVYKTPVNSESLSTLGTGSSVAVPSASSETHALIKKEPFSLEAAFKRTSLLSVASLNSHISQKIVSNEIPNDAQGLFAEYLTCPTIGDGDCFFHAAVTEPGEAPEVVSARASTLREQFYNLIQTDDVYARRFAPLLYEHYSGLRGTPGSENIPSSIRTLFQEDDEYVAARRTLIELGVNPLPAQISSEQRHSVEHITNQISLDNIRTYMERFRVVGGPRTYIPFRKGTFCPAEALSLLGGKRVNIFTYNKNTHQLDIYKEATAPATIPNVDISNFPIINILHAGDHYIRLLNPAESGLHKSQSQQIMRNSGH